MQKILLTNDDGFSSKFLQDLYTYVDTTYSTTECILVAPKQNSSGVSQAIVIDQPLVYQKIEENQYELNGYPTDCTMIGLDMLGPIDLVISGPNNGANLGEDILYSGTIAATREAAFHNIPALAFSFVNDDNKYFDLDYMKWHSFLDKWLKPLVKLACSHKGSIVNVNISNPISLDLVEGVLGVQHYYNYTYSTSCSNGDSLYYMALIKKGTDHSQPRIPDSDVEYALSEKKSVFTVFSAWPIQSRNTLAELLTYVD